MPKTIRESSRIKHKINHRRQLKTYLGSLHPITQLFCYSSSPKSLKENLVNRSLFSLKIIPSHSFSLLCAFLQRQSQHSPFSASFLTYILAPKTQICSKKENLPFPFFYFLHFCNPFFFFFLYVFVLASQKLNFFFLKKIHFLFFYFPYFRKSKCFSLSMQDLLFPYVCSHINPLFPPIYIYMYIYLPSLSAHALVRVDQQLPILLSNDKNENRKNKTRK